MGFPTNVADEVLVRCSRHCCLCDRYVGSKIELHHIKQVSDGGDDSIDNCIPLCFDCHAEVKAYNNKHPKGRKFTEKELKGHRDKCYMKYSLDVIKNENKDNSDEQQKTIFKSHKSHVLPQWGYSELDRVCPLALDNMILIAGYTGMSKSKYLHHIVNFNIKRNQKVAYCGVKDNPTNVALEIIAEDANLNTEDFTKGRFSDDDIKKIKRNINIPYSNNLAIVPYDEISTTSDIISLVEHSGADMIVIDDLNGVLFENDETILNFFYRLKSKCIRNNVMIFVIYNLKVPSRLDKHPMLSDFPSDDYYRLFDIVQLLYKPKLLFADDCNNDNLEIIIQKGALNQPCIIKL